MRVSPKDVMLDNALNQVPPLRLTVSVFLEVLVWILFLKSKYTLLSPVVLTLTSSFMPAAISSIGVADSHVLAPPLRLPETLSIRPSPFYWVAQNKR